MSVSVYTKKPFTVAAMRHGGTHLINPVVRRLTNKPVYSPKGASSLVCTPSSIVIVFPRDPRNRAVSNVRYKLGREAVDRLDEAGRDEALFHYLSTRKSGDALLPIEFMTRWAQRWCHGKFGNAGTHWMLCRFEELAGPNALLECTKIATFLKEVGADLVCTPDVARAYALGTSGTFTGRHSNYREWFGPKSIAFWNRNFGPSCTMEMGYNLDQVNAL